MIRRSLGVGHRRSKSGGKGKYWNGLVLELKKKWPCQNHQGEHGEPGHCYIAPSGEHTHLNPHHLKAWAAAMSAGDATKHEPPNHPAFDGVRNAAAAGPKPRGHPTASDSGCDALVMLVNALVSLIEPPSTVTNSPIPKKGSELHHCLLDFARLEGVDLLPCSTHGMVIKFKKFCKEWQNRLEQKFLIHPQAISAVTCALA
ncbi:hypothetical protein BYT27DRAFT_7241680 [Phlegmacium glaucopus]|nr:hypothetical protein BYT27DRAFT_7241680 [Phlegmacium glaucopus]